MKITIALAAVLFAGSAHAGIISESESNNTMGTANDIGTYNEPGDGTAISGTLTEGDVDWFSFTLADTASLAFFSAFGASGDGVMQLVTDTGDVIAFDDDSGVGLFPALQVTDLAAGTYFIAFSGFGDVDGSSVDSDELADGLGHSENFAYKISVGFSIIPAPSAMALLGMGGLVATRRRR